jgi:hypothetical protein
MRTDPKSLRIVTFTVLAAGLLLGGCSGMNFSMPSFSGGSSSDTPPPPAPSGGGALPSKYAPEEFVGRWGYTSYQNEADRARTVAQARGLCKTPYVIARGPTGGVMMHLADDKQPSELRLKGSPDGKNYIGPDGDAGVAQDQEIITFDGRVMVTRYVDPDAAKRYGNMVRVKCQVAGAPVARR